MPTFTPETMWPTLIEESFIPVKAHTSVESGARDPCRAGARGGCGADGVHVSHPSYGLEADAGGGCSEGIDSQALRRPHQRPGTCSSRTRAPARAMPGCGGKSLKTTRSGEGAGPGSLPESGVEVASRS